MKTFLEYLESSRKNIISEGFSEKSLSTVHAKIDSILKKHIDGLVPLVGYCKINADKNTYWAKQYLVCGKTPADCCMFQINWVPGDKYEVYSIDFFKDVSLLCGDCKSDLTIYTLGSSIVYFMPIIWTVINKRDFSLSEKEAIEVGRTIFKGSNDVKESKYWVGPISYRIVEGMSSDDIRDTTKMVYEAGKYDGIDPRIEVYRQKKGKETREVYARKKANPSPEMDALNRKVSSEYLELKAALEGGARTIDDLKVAIKRNVHIIAEIVGGETAQQEEEKLEQEHEDPEVVFKKMQHYVKMVIKGINPSVILCGAPGVGKTYNVKQQLKAAGYNEGHNLFTIKGKCTPRRLYLALYEYQKKGEIVLIDDADGLVGPKAPEDCINILKGALDSSSDDEGRLVSYGVTGKIMDDEGVEIPKRFYYNGSVIIITNYNAGQLDTALRGRSFIQDIHFTTEDVLKRIKEIMPAIDPEHLSAKSKIKALDYLTEIKDNNMGMEISIRTFGICAKVFATAEIDDDFTEEEARSIIKEQMKLQALRGGKKY